MKTLPRLLLLLLWASAPSLPAEERPAPLPEFTLDASTVAAGRTLTVTCRLPAHTRAAALYWNGRENRFYSVEKDEWRAFVGIPSDKKPGHHIAIFRMEDRTGHILADVVPFVIAGATYPVSVVRLPSQKNPLVTSGQVARDAKTLERFYAGPPSTQKRWKGRFAAPARGIISSPYGARRSFGGSSPYTPHSGVDIANKAGTRITAPAAGRVAYAAWLDGFGFSVVLDHGQGVCSYYLHMRKLFVKQGRHVKRETPLGEMGEEGIATGPHLHWTLAVNGERVDPLEWTQKEFR